MKQFSMSVLLIVGVALIASAIKDWNWIPVMIGGAAIGVYHVILYDELKGGKK